MRDDLLAGARVRLTTLEKEDAPSIAAWSGDIEYLRFQDTRMALPLTVEEAEEEIRALHNGYDALSFGIRTVDDDRLIGSLGFYDIEWANRSGWLGMGIGDRAYWGRGYGREALALALRYAFGELNLHRLSLTVAAYNERAIALYEGAGFRKEGVLREFGERDEKRYDLVLYGLLRTEWTEGRA